MEATRDEYLASGHQKELKAFRNYVLSARKYMDNAPHNRASLPFVKQHLS